MRDLFGIVGFFDLSERGSALGFFLILSLRVRDRNHARPYGMSLILELVESPRDTLSDASLLTATLKVRFLIICPLRVAHFLRSRKSLSLTATSLSPR